MKVLNQPVPEGVCAHCRKPLNPTDELAYWRLRTYHDLCADLAHEQLRC